MFVANKNITLKLKLSLQTKEIYLKDDENQFIIFDLYDGIYYKGNIYHSILIRQNNKFHIESLYRDPFTFINTYAFLISGKCGQHGWYDCMWISLHVIRENHYLSNRYNELMIELVNLTTNNLIIKPDPDTSLYNLNMDYYKQVINK